MHIPYPPHQYGIRQWPCTQLHSIFSLCIHRKCLKCLCKVLFQVSFHPFVVIHIQVLLPTLSNHQQNWLSYRLHKFSSQRYVWYEHRRWRLYGEMMLAIKAIQCIYCPIWKESQKHARQVVSNTGGLWIKPLLRSFPVWSISEMHLWPFEYFLTSCCLCSSKQLHREHHLFAELLLGEITQLS